MLPMNAREREKAACVVRRCDCVMTACCGWPCVQWPLLVVVLRQSACCWDGARDVLIAVECVVKAKAVTNVMHVSVRNKTLLPYRPGLDKVKISVVQSTHTPFDCAHSARRPFASRVSLCLTV